jgi:hypothetical protein
MIAYLRNKMHKYSNQCSCTSNKWNVLPHSDHTSYIEFNYFLLWTFSPLLIWQFCTVITQYIIWTNSQNIPVQIIKSNLQPQNNIKPIYYYIGTWLGQILHTRLRMQCISLNHWWTSARLRIYLYWGYSLSL